MWLYVPASTRSASAPAEEVSTSGSDWRFQALASSAWWRGKPSPSRTWSRRCDRVSWMTRLSGAMPEPSTAALGVARWIALLAEFPASLTPSPAGGSARRTSATSGPTLAASSYKRARGSSSSRTSRECSRPAGPSEFGETFADLASRLRSDYSARKRSARATSVSESSSSRWPTAQARDGDPRGRSPDPSRVGDPKRHGGYNLDDWAAKFSQEAIPSAKMWPTPAARDFKGANGADHLDNGSGRLHLDQLPNFVEHMWMTPRVERGAYTRDRGDHESPRLTLEGQSRFWTRPSVADTMETRGRQASSLASLLPDRPISTVGEESSHIRRTLNPLFVEWLMGWPPGWTLLGLTPPASSSYACSETALSLYRRRMRSELSALGSPPAVLERQLSLL